MPLLSSNGPWQALSYVVNAMLSDLKQYCRTLPLAGTSLQLPPEKRCAGESALQAGPQGRGIEVRMKLPPEGRGFAKGTIL